MSGDLADLLTSNTSVPLWPTAGKAVGLGRNATYEAAKRGEIPTGRRIPVRQHRSAECSASTTRRVWREPRLEYQDKKELAAELHVSTRTIERWMRSGEAPPFVKVGARKALFERTAVAEWAKARTYRSIAAEMAADATAKERLNDHDP